MGEAVAGEPSTLAGVLCETSALKTANIHENNTVAWKRLTDTVEHRLPPFLRITRLRNYRRQEAAQ